MPTLLADWASSAPIAMRRLCYPALEAPLAGTGTDDRTEPAERPRTARRAAWSTLVQRTRTAAISRAASRACYVPGEKKPAQDRDAPLSPRPRARSCARRAPRHAHPDVAARTA